MLRPDRRSTFVLCTLLATAAPGCGLVDLLDGESVATVRFFATHAGTPTEEGYPFYGDEETTRVFYTDLGWQIALSEVYVTTAAVRFVPCAASTGIPIVMFWGPCPESFVTVNDLESVPLGAVTADDDDYCTVEVEFGPFTAPPDGDEHIAVGNSMIRDNTLVVVGIARRGEGPTLEEYPFEVVSDTTRKITLDVSKLELGSPVHLEDEQFPRDLTIIKIYDRFFDGLDFSVATPAEIEASVLAALDRDTFVYDGTVD